MADMDQRLADLLDREEISRQLTTYAYALDVRDWALYRSIFTDAIEMDFSASIGEGGPLTVEANQWVEMAKPFFERLPATQHIGIPLHIRLDGNEAYAVSSLHAQHFLPNTHGDPVQRMIGRYENWLRRTDQGWRIYKVVQHIDWNEGNWRVFELAAAAGEDT